MRRIDTSAELKTKLQQTLTLSDLVKFAKEQPLPHENENSLTYAIEFVKGTIPEAINRYKTCLHHQTQIFHNPKVLHSHDELLKFHNICPPRAFLADACYTGIDCVLHFQT